MEPTAADVQAVAQAMGEQPQAQQAPAPQAPAPQPTQPTETPAQPTQPTETAQPTDPFATFSQQPTQPTQTVTQPTAPTTTAVTQPTAPTNPAPATQPGEVVQPTEAPVQPTQPTEQPQSFEEYIKSIVGEEPAPVSAPDFTQVNGEDEAAVKGFFDDLLKQAAAQAKAEIIREQNIQNAERKGWEAAFSKYPSLRTNQQIRDLVHNVRMGYFQRGLAITPTQAAEELLKTMGNQYQKGIADNQVQTTIQKVQPVGSVSPAVATAPVTEQVVNEIAAGNSDALANYLDAEIKAGRL